MAQQKSKHRQLLAVVEFDAEITKIVTENASDATVTHAQATARVVVRTLEQTLRLRLVQTQVFVGDPQWRIGTAADVLCQSATRADDDRFVVVEVKSSPQPYLCDVCYRSPARLTRGGSYYARHQLQLWLTVTLLERAGVRVNRSIFRQADFIDLAVRNVVDVREVL